jgi:hypothetical protein
VIQGSRAQRSFDSSPGLIAVFHALRRLPAPRHPPHALGSLAAPTLPPQNGNREGTTLPNRPRKAGVTILLSFRAHAEIARNEAPAARRPGLRLVNCNSYRFPNCQRTTPGLETGPPRKDSRSLALARGRRTAQMPRPAISEKHTTLEIYRRFRQQLLTEEAKQPKLRPQSTSFFADNLMI